MLTVSKLNDVYLKVDCDPGTSQELSDYFTFTVPGARFMPQVQNRFWDGKIRLYNQMTKQIYFGLYPKVEEFCKQRGYKLNIEEDRAFFQSEFALKGKTHIIEQLCKNHIRSRAHFAHQILQICFRAGGFSVRLWITCDRDTKLRKFVAN